jgi:hypothetical protein
MWIFYFITLSEKILNAFTEFIIIIIVIIIIIIVIIFFHQWLPVILVCI